MQSAPVSQALVQGSSQKSCNTRAHDRLKASTKAWCQAAFVGYQTGFPATHLYEMRLCPVCGSSLVRAIVITQLRYVRSPRIAVVTPAAPARLKYASAGGRA